jgi:hypothetical protein
MTQWTATIEITESKPKALDSLDIIAYKTASKVDLFSDQHVYTYYEDRTLDLAVMADKARTRASALLMINGHAIDFMLIRPVLNCVNYGLSFGGNFDGSICYLCPRHESGCEKHISKKINAIFGKGEEQH